MEKIFLAIEKGRFSTVKSLVKRLKDVNIKNEDGNTLLNYAIDCRQERIALFLIGRGVDPNLTNNKGRTPINTASVRGCAKVARALIGIRVNYLEPDNKGWLPVGNATYFGKDKVKELLGDACYIKIGSRGAYTTGCGIIV